MHHLRKIEPAQAVGDLRHRLGKPQGRLLFPKATSEPIRLPGSHSFFHRALITPQAQLLSRHLAGQQRLAFLLQGSQQLLKGSRKGSHAVGLQFVCDHIQVYSELCQTGQSFVRLCVPLLHGRSWCLPGVAEGVQGGGGNGVDRVRANQLFDVKDVGIGRVLGARAGPEGPLDAGTPFAQGGKRVAVENLAEATVDHFGVGNGDSTSQGQSVMGADHF